MIAAGNNSISGAILTGNNAMQGPVQVGSSVIANMIGLLKPFTARAKPKTPTTSTTVQTPTTMSTTPTSTTPMNIWACGLEIFPDDPSSWQSFFNSRSPDEMNTILINYSNAQPI